MSDGHPQHHVTLLDSVAGGGIVDEIMSRKYDKKI